MLDVNVLAVAAAAVAAFVASGIYYAALSSRAARYSAAWADSAAQPAWKVAQEPFRGLVTAAAVAVVASLVGLDGVTDVGVLVATLWLGFPAMLLAGSVIHENVPWQLAVIHAGDWLLKLAIMGAIVGAWR